MTKAQQLNFALYCCSDQYFIPFTGEKRQHGILSLKILHVLLAEIAGHYQYFSEQKSKSISQYKTLHKLFIFSLHNTQCALRLHIVHLYIY